MESQILGRWSASGRAIEVARRGGDLVLLAPGAPTELAPRLVPSGPDEFTIAGGSFTGLSVTLGERDGVPHVILGGRITLPRWEENGVPTVVGTPAPEVATDAATLAVYERFYETARVAGGAEIAVPTGVSLSSWVGWLSARQVVLFHGSAAGDITELSPRRTSYELNDEGERGNLPGVYATDEGLWSLWFAVVDRARLRGTIRSGVDHVDRPDGSPLGVYYFSVDHRDLPLDPWHDGWLYLLPRETFTQLPVLPGGPPSNEWCSTEPVRPLARLRVRPADFPFLARVCGHDDGEWLDYGELTRQVMDRVVETVPTEDGVRLRLAPANDLAELLAEFGRLSAEWMPEVSVDPDTDPTVLHLRTAPGLTAMLQHKYGV